VMREVGSIVVSKLQTKPKGCNSDSLGMSMRLAFDLGLHLDMTPYVNQGQMSPSEAEVRRAAFWGSYVADQ
jgi:hypothetical protein